MKSVFTVALALTTTFVTRAVQAQPQQSAPADLLALQQGPGQQRGPRPLAYRLSGQVLAPNGRPLPGATILLKGTQQATSTDANGKYTLLVPSQTANVVLAGYAGYEEQTLTVAANQPLLNVNLRPLPATALTRGLRTGDLAPDFELPTTTGTSFRLSEHRGHPVVLYFYPKDGSNGCTKEACSFRDQYQDFRDLGAEVIGISSDDAASHQQFTAKYALPFPLLADQGGKLRKQYAVPRAVLGLLPGRVTYVLDAEGRVRYVFNSLTDATDHVLNAKQILKTL